MNVGKIVFAQIMQFIPRREFNDIVAKYRGNYKKVLCLFERIPIPELFNKPIINVPKDDGQLDLFRNLKS